jgi:hypothetical protein
VEYADLLHVPLVELEVVQLDVRDGTLGGNQLRVRDAPVRLINYTRSARRQWANIPLLKGPARDARASRSHARAGSTLAW